MRCDKALMRSARYVSRMPAERHGRLRSFPPQAVTGPAFTPGCGASPSLFSPRWACGEPHAHRGENMTLTLPSPKGRGRN